MTHKQKNSKTQTNKRNPMKQESNQLGRATGPAEVRGEQESVMGG